MQFGASSGKSQRYERDLQQVYDSLYRAALRMTRDETQAVDLVQEATIRGFEAYDRFDGKNFKGWMLTILTNLYINKYRSRQRGPQFRSTDDEFAQELVGDEREAPDYQVFDDLLGDEVEAALAKVPDNFREAVILSDIEGLSYDEIAESLKIPIGTVRSRLARGRRLLREQLRNYALREGFIKKGDITTEEN
jgi:RNA polymerase sigma-70 factor (ECF subfamily)